MNGRNIVMAVIIVGLLYGATECFAYWGHTNKSKKMISEEEYQEIRRRQKDPEKPHPQGKYVHAVPQSESTRACAHIELENPDALIEKAQSGDAYARACLGESYARGELGFDQDLAVALKWLKESAEQGHPVAYYNLGRMYGSGLGIQEDHQKSEAFYAKAFPGLLKDAEAADARWQCNLGAMYELGLGAVPTNLEKAASWYRTSAAQGYARAQCNLATCYQQGRGVPQDRHAAADWFAKAAAQEDPRGQLKLGLAYIDGIGLDQDISRGFELVTKAAEQRDPTAQYFLGMAYRGRFGMEKNLSQAERWLRKAAQQGNERAEAELKELVMELNWSPEAALDEAAKHKSETLVFKGLYLGMDIAQACRLLNHHLGFNLKISNLETPQEGVFSEVAMDFDTSTGNEMQDMANLEVNLAKSLMAAWGIEGKKYDIRVTASEAHKVTAVYIRGRHADLMFKSHDMDVGAFAKAFIDAYDIPAMQGYQEIVTEKEWGGEYVGWYDKEKLLQGYEYTSPQGWKLRVTEDKDVILTTVTKASERAFD